MIHGDELCTDGCILGFDLVFLFVSLLGVVLNHWAFGMELLVLVSCTGVFFSPTFLFFYDSLTVFFGLGYAMEIPILRMDLTGIRACCMYQGLSPL